MLCSEEDEHPRLQYFSVAVYTITHRFDNCCIFKISGTKVKMSASSIETSVFIILLLLSLTSVLSFVAPRNALIRSTSLMLSSKPPTYAELLQASKASKQNNSAPRQPAIAPVIRNAPAVSTEIERQAVDELPFDDAIYEHLKFVIGISFFYVVSSIIKLIGILCSSTWSSTYVLFYCFVPTGKLSSRMKSDKPLTPDELKSFKNSCTEIIRDAKTVLAKAPEKSAPASRTVAPAATEPVLEFQNVGARRDGKDRVHKPPVEKRVTQKESEFVIYEMGEGPTSDERPDPNSEFSALHGLKNTWEMPGMDNMTTDEYYAAINARIVSMKNKRKQTPGNSNTMVNDYFESLSRPRAPT